MSQEQTWFLFYKITLEEGGANRNSKQGIKPENFFVLFQKITFSFVMYQLPDFYFHNGLTSLSSQFCFFKKTIISPSY